MAGDGEVIVIRKALTLRRRLLAVVLHVRSHELVRRQSGHQRELARQRRSGDDPGENRKALREKRGGYGYDHVGASHGLLPNLSESQHFS